MIVETARFGPLELPDDRLITFPGGLPGFRGKRWFLVAGGASREKTASLESPLEPAWLQSTEQPEVAILLVDPTVLEPTYSGIPKAEEIRLIEPGERPAETLKVRVIVRAGEEPGELLVNFFAPVLVNPTRRLAMQVPLVGSSYGAREIWPPRPHAAPTAPDHDSDAP